MNLVHIFGGGTVAHIRSHLALCAPAYGNTARELYRRFSLNGVRAAAELHLTRMADQFSRMETNADVEHRLSLILADQDTRAVIFNVAMCDFDGQIGTVPSGKYADRLQSRGEPPVIQLTPAAKVLATIKKTRPDVFVVGFKTTANKTVAEQLTLARRQIDETGTDLVMANDTVTRRNLLVFKDQAPQGIEVECAREELLSAMVGYIRGLL